ncbi:MAG: hypothetical protein AAF466_00885 [Bacteroidota bacterium]
MKTFKSFLLAAVLLTGTTVFATNPIGDKVNKDEAAQEIAQLLENPNFEYEDGTEAQVTLKVNSNGTLEVVSVATKNRRAVKFIQNRLENQKLESSLEAGKTYTLPVTFQSLS